MSWKFGESPEPYELRFRNAKYALVLVMGGDCDLGVHLDGDFAEMTRARCFRSSFRESALVEVCSTPVDQAQRQIKAEPGKPPTLTFGGC